MATRYRAGILALALLGTACGDPAPTETATSREAAEIVAPSTTARSTTPPSTATTSLDVLAELAAKESVEVLVAVRDIPAGTNGADVARLLEVAVIPLELRPSSALRPDEIDTLVGLVTVHAIAKNQLIIPTYFTEPPLESSPADLPEGTVAMSFPHDFVSPAAPMLALGDTVEFTAVADDGAFLRSLGSGEVIDVSGEHYGFAISQDTATLLVTAQATNVVLRRSAG